MAESTNLHPSNGEKNVEAKYNFSQLNFVCDGIQSERLLSVNQIHVELHGGI
jgi:hypothetical protein